MFRLTDNQERRATPSCPSDSHEVAFPSMRDGRRAERRAAKTEAIRILGASYGAGCRVGHLSRPAPPLLTLILRHPSLSLCFLFLFHLSFSLTLPLFLPFLLAFFFLSVLFIPDSVFFFVLFLSLSISIINCNFLFKHMTRFIR